MRKTIVKNSLFALCTALVVGSGVSAVVYANSLEKEPATQSESVTTTGELPALSEDLTNGVLKDETVYILTDTTGTVNKIIVSDWKNTNGTDTYTQSTSEAQPPVSLHITYTLNGEEISPAALAGKNGTVTIRFDYENTCKQTVSINGKKETLSVPFAIATGMLLDAERFTDVTVTNGKLVNDGNHLAIIGFVLPGMQESLALPKERLELPSYFEISATVRNFELPNTVTVVTNEVFNKLDITKLDSVTSLSGSTTELSDAMTQLMGGSSALYEGLCALLEKSGELTTGITSLSGGLKELTSNNKALNDGSKEVFYSLLALANNQIAAAGIPAPELTIENYGTVLDGVIASLGAKMAELPEQHPANETITAAITSLTGLKAQLDNYNKFYTGLNQYTTGVSQVYAGVRQMEQDTPALIDGITALKDGALQLSEGLVTFNEEGIQKLIGTLNETVSDLPERIHAISEASRSYNSFTGNSEGSDSQVKFIYRTDAVTAEN